MTKIVMLGISGLDADLLRVYGPLLPTVRHLTLESPFLECRASFPPTPVSAWTSINTGLNPANSGMIGRSGMVDCERDSSQHFPGHGIYRGETFWDVARRAGKRVFANVGATRTLEEPLLNSAMISRLRKPDEFCSLLYEKTTLQAASALKTLRNEPWDVFFWQFDALDYAQHVLWRYSDPGDPGYPARNTYAHLIPDFYGLFDRILSSFRAAMAPECILVVASGYGFGRRCIRRLQVNEWLRSQQLLTPSTGSQRWLHRRYLPERGNIRPAKLIAQLQLWDGMPDSRNLPPSRKGLPREDAGILVEKTVAQVVDLAGVSPFGGIRLNRVCIEQGEHSYEQVRSMLLADLMRLRVKGQRVVNWAKAREDVYSGQLLERLPDILFELRSDFGVDTQLHVPVVTQEPVSRLISGERTMGGVLLLGNLPDRALIRNDVREPAVEDVAPTILSLLDIASANLDGKALVQLQPVNVIANLPH